ncbi:hypothetical protein MIR68_008578 [Amoeboaphelidium protococcarum]|nr:hypothetical protein MIR68_008578 [Amoeboaphelidium protococcarum]
MTQNQQYSVIQQSEEIESDNNVAVSDNHEQPLLTPTAIDTVSNVDDDDDEEEVADSADVFSEGEEEILMDAAASQTVRAANDVKVHNKKNSVIMRSDNDGVFSNLNEKPQSSRNSRQNINQTPDVNQVQDEQREDPPSYESAANDQAPPYVININQIFGAGMPDLVDENGQPLEFDPTEALELVGKPYTFIFTAIVTMAFQLIGFFACFLFSRSLAGKAGARAGFGLILVQYGSMILNGGRATSLSDDGSVTVGKGGVRSDPIGYGFIALGFLVSASSAFQYIHTRKKVLRTLSSSSSIV